MTSLKASTTERSELAGKVAVITGASRNIGRAIALTVADAGAAVVVNARVSKTEAASVAKEIEGRGGRAAVHMADVSDERMVSGLVNSAISRFGRLDIMICNAAIRLDRPVLETSYEDFQAMLNATVGSSFLCAKAAIPHLIAVGGGAIVMIGGIGGHVGTIGRCASTSGKAAVAGLTRALAAELGPKRITVNCVAPGLIDTVGRIGVPAHLKQPSPLGRRGTPDEVAAAVRLLCGPGGQFITGQTIHVNGGLLMAG